MVRYLSLLLSIGLLNSHLCGVTRAAYSRTGDMIRIPTTPNNNKFRVGLAREIHNFNPFNTADALFYDIGIGRGFSFGFSLVVPGDTTSLDLLKESMYRPGVEFGFHFQQRVYTYNDISVSIGLQDVVFQFDQTSEEILSLNTSLLSFFGVLSRKKDFGAFKMSNYIGFGTGGLTQTDPNTMSFIPSDSSAEKINIGVFAGIALKTPFIKDNGGLDLLAEFDGSGVNLGMHIPLSPKYRFDIGFTQIGKLSEFGERYWSGHPGFSLGFTMMGPKKLVRTNVGGPSATVDGENGKLGRPADCGSAEIDNFKNAAFDLNDKIVELKEKLKGVSNGLTESNKVLSEIGNSSSGPVGWALVELQKGFSQSKNSITSAVQSLKSDIPDLPEIYFALIKESMISPETLEELLKGTEPEEALVATFNKKAKEKGVPTTSKEWIKSLNLELDPTKALKLKLGKINEGIVGGKDKLVSVPDDLKAIGEQAKSLLASAGELPKAAKSLGFSKAPAALKSIKATTGVLKNIPNEVTAIGDESKKVMEEIDKVLKNIQSILSTT
jgi:hypothetical protein